MNKKRINYTKMTKKEYFEKFDLKITDEVANALNKAEDIAYVFDAFYLRKVLEGYDTKPLTLKEFQMSKKTVGDYFNGILEGEDVFFDLSESLSSIIWCFAKNELNTEEMMGKELVEITGLEDSDKYLFEL